MLYNTVTLILLQPYLSIRVVKVQCNVVKTRFYYLGEQLKFPFYIHVYSAGDQQALHKCR